MQIEKDKISGQSTTGHVWDGIKELDTPTPKAVIWAYWISIAIALSGWLYFPSIPYGVDFWRGTSEYSSREEVLDSIAHANIERVNVEQDILVGEYAELVKDPTLRSKHLASASVLFNDNCSVCHGRDLQGQKGFPNLADSQWLFGSDPDEIEWTIRYGINASHDDTRYNEMPAFGRDELLEADSITSLVEYVLSLSGKEHTIDQAVLGREIFADECSSCHGDDGAGLETGAPNLTDSFWIYGGQRDDITQTLQNGRSGTMPHWDSRLDDTQIRKLVLYLGWIANDRN